MICSYGEMLQVALDINSLLELLGTESECTHQLFHGQMRSGLRRRSQDVTSSSGWRLTKDFQLRIGLSLGECKCQMLVFMRCCNRITSASVLQLSFCQSSVAQILWTPPYCTSLRHQLSHHHHSTAKSGLSVRFLVRSEAYTPGNGLQHLEGAKC